MMKTFKVTAFITLTSLMLASCSMLKEPVETSEKSRKTKFSEQTSETTSETYFTTTDFTDPESSETSESVKYSYNPQRYEKAKWKIEPTLIYDDHDVKITVEELLNTQQHTSVAISFWIENNSDEDFTFDVKELAVNTLCSRILYYEATTIESKKCDTFFVGVDFKYLASLGIEDISRLDVAIRGSNVNGYASIDPEPVTIYTDHQDNIQMPSLPNATVIHDDENIFASASVLGKTDEEAALFRIFVTNKSDSNITVKATRLWFGGKDLKNAINITVPAGMSKDVYYSFDDPTIIRSVSSQKITQMELALGYHIPGKYNSDTESKTVSFSVN